MTSSMEQGQHSEYQANLEKLMEIPFFAGLPLEALKLIAYFCTRETFQPGEYLFQEDDVDGNAFYFLQGKATLLREDASQPVLNTISEGEFVGRFALLGEMKRLFSLKAEEETICIVLSREKFKKTLEQFPEIMDKILESTVEAVYQWEFRFLVKHAESCPDCQSGIGVSLL